MDRNIRSSYVNSGSRSLPHMHSKRHNNAHNNGYNGARYSPPNQSSYTTAPQNGGSQYEDIINYVHESWNKVSREVQRGSKDIIYYQEVLPPRHLANFRPFNLEDLWARRLVQSINRNNKHRY